MSFLFVLCAAGCVSLLIYAAWQLYRQLGGAETVYRDRPPRGFELLWPVVNIMANKSLMLCFGEGKQQVSSRHVALAANDTVSSAKGWRWPWLAAGVSLLIAACGLTWALTK